MRKFLTKHRRADVARNMPASPRHHLWPDPACGRTDDLSLAEAGSTGTQELLVFAALIATAVLIAAVWNLRDFMLLSGGATLGALIVGRMAAVTREQAQESEA